MTWRKFKQWLTGSDIRRKLDVVIQQNNAILGILANDPKLVVLANKLKKSNDQLEKTVRENQ